MKTCTRISPNHSGTFVARLFAAAPLLASAGSALAAIRYVDLNSPNPTSPYINWAMAATNIQDAIDAAPEPGAQVLVTNGIYAPITANTRLTPLSVRSLNGPEVTVIDGAGASGCGYVVGGETLSGFTLTNGATLSDGGGVRCESPAAVVFNCVLAGNSAYFGRGASSISARRFWFGPIGQQWPP